MSDRTRGPRTTRRGVLVAVGTAGIAGGATAAGIRRQAAAATSRRAAAATNPRAAAATSRQAGGEWRLFQADEANTGHVPGGAGPTGPVGARWRFDAVGSVTTTPVVTADTVYVADGDADRLRAVDRADGTQRWAVRSGMLDARPTVADGVVYVPGYQVQAVDAADGSVRWSKNVSRLTHSVVVSGDTAFVGGRAGLTAYWADSGTERWHNDRVEYRDGALAVVGDVVYGTNAMAGTVVALDTAGGGRKWLRRLDGDVTGAPTVAGGRVFVPRTGALQVMDAITGVHEWRYDVDVRSSVAVADGVVYGTGGGGVTYALDAATGTEQWRRQVGASTNPPVVVGGLVYVVGDDGTLTALSPDDGSTVWQRTVGGRKSAAAAVAGGELYVGDHAGTLYALAAGVSGGTPTRTSSPVPPGTTADTPGTGPASPGGTGTETSPGGASGNDGGSGLDALVFNPVLQALAGGAVVGLVLAVAGTLGARRLRGGSDGGEADTDADGDGDGEEYDHPF